MNVLTVLTTLRLTAKSVQGFPEAVHKKLVFILLDPNDLATLIGFEKQKLNLQMGSMTNTW